MLGQSDWQVDGQSAACQITKRCKCRQSLAWCVICRSTCLLFLFLGYCFYKWSQLCRRTFAWIGSCISSLLCSSVRIHAMLNIRIMPSFGDSVTLKIHIAFLYCSLRLSPDVYSSDCSALQGFPHLCCHSSQTYSGSVNYTDIYTSTTVYTIWHRNHADIPQANLKVNFWKCAKKCNSLWFEYWYFHSIYCIYISTCHLHYLGFSSFLNIIILLFLREYCSWMVLFSTFHNLFFN